MIQIPCKCKCCYHVSRLLTLSRQENISWLRSIIWQLSQKKVMCLNPKIFIKIYWCCSNTDLALISSNSDMTCFVNSDCSTVLIWSQKWKCWGTSNFSYFTKFLTNHTSLLYFVSCWIETNNCVVISSWINFIIISYSKAPCLTCPMTFHNLFFSPCLLIYCQDFTKLCCNQ